jgi:hypothetical protein
MRENKAREQGAPDPVDAKTSNVPPDAKSDLAQSVDAELQQFHINKPVIKVTAKSAPASANPQS